MASESLHISIHVERSADDVYDYASDPLNLPHWAPGLCTSVDHVDGRWIAETGMGTVVLTFAPRNPFGVLDHDVALPSGETVHNPMRVVPHDAGCEVVFSLRRQPDMSDEEFERDGAAVLADLVRIKELLESGQGRRNSDR
jgi:hypothetical protein